MIDKITKMLSSFFGDSDRIHEEKNRIRSDIRVLKKMLTQEQKEKEAETVFGKIESLPKFKTAKTVLIYWSTPDELPTHSFVKKWSAHKTMILPSVKGDRLLLKKFTSDTKMIQRALGIFEPDLPDTFIGKIDLVIVPGVAFDAKKNRLGRGKGYYDRFFKRNKTMKIGVSFDFQLVATIPVNKLDKQMDMIITPSDTIE